MEEDLRCIPFIDGVVHSPHTYTPQDTEVELPCEGVRDLEGYRGSNEMRVSSEYKLAMWLDYSGVRTLHKTRAAEDFAEAAKWLLEFEEDYLPGVWFIIREVTETRSYIA